MEDGNNVDKYPKMLEPSRKRWLSEHYSPEEAKEQFDMVTKILNENEILLIKIGHGHLVLVFRHILRGVTAM